jgi:hypothetical protein
MRRLALGAASATFAAATLAAGCAANNPSPVSASAAKAMRPLVAQLRSAADGHSIFAAEQAEQALVDKVQSLQESGDLNPKRAQNIDDAAVRLLTDFKHHNEPTPPPTTATPTETLTESPTATPTVTVTAPPTETTSATPTDSTSATPKKTKTGDPLFPH